MKSKNTTIKTVKSFSDFLCRELSNAIIKYLKTYSDKIYDVVTIDEGIEEVSQVGTRHGLELTISIIKAKSSVQNDTLSYKVEINDDVEAVKDLLPKTEKYIEPSEPYKVSFEELDVIHKLLKAKKLTNKQKEAIRSLVIYYYSTD